MLLEIEGEHIRVFTGLAMRWRLVQVLGPVRALRAAQAVICGVQMASPPRMQPLLLSFLILLTMLLTSHNASAYSVCCKWSTNYATYRYGYLPMAFWDPTDRGASAWTSVPTTSWRYIKYSGSPNYIEWGRWPAPRPARWHPPAESVPGWTAPRIPDALKRRGKGEGCWEDPAGIPARSTRSAREGTFDFPE